jgi:arabinogalactan oligomer/maltooligosaccharide transport system permease protein
MCLAFVALCAWCWGASPAWAEPIAVSLWHSYRGLERVALEATVGEFNTQHPGIRIEATFLPYNAYLDKLNASIPRGHGPDIFIAAHDRIGGWADSGHIAPLPDALTSVTNQRFFSKTIEPLVYRRQQYGLPTAFKSTALFYNRALVDRPPGDTDEMIALARRLTSQAAGEQARYGLAWNHSDFYTHACWWFGFKGVLFDSRGQLRLDAPANVASVAFVRDLVAEGLLPQDVDPVKITTLFNSNRAAMVIQGPWFPGEIDAGIDFGVATLPEVGQTGVPAQPYVSTEAFLLSARARHPEQALAVIDWLTRDEAAGIRMRQGLQPVANLGLYAQSGPGIDPVLAVFRDQLKSAVPMRSDPEMGLLWEPLKQALDEAIAGRATPAQALAEAQREASMRVTEFRAGSALRQSGGGQEQFSQAVFWGVGGGLLVLLALIAVFFERFKRLLREAWRQRAAYGYIGPAMLTIGLLVFVPFLVGLGLGFFRYYQGEYFYVGGRNFVDILSSREYALTDAFSFYYKLFITVLWTGLNVFLHLAIGLGLALLLKDPLLKLRGFYRVLLIIPWAIPNYITAIVWRGMFDADDGVINHLLGMQGFSWWQSTPTAFAANLMTNCWLGFPFMMVVCLGALQSIPRELYEAADVDGASRWQKFRRITLPLLKPALFPAIILGSIWTFNMFNVIYLVSRGAPNGGTDILVIEAFRWAFERGDRYGYAAAYSALIFVILFVYTLMTNRITRATEGAFD